MKYQVKILSSKDFDELPIPNVRESLGVADPKKKTAYVRYTSVPALNKYLVSHELEHLLGEDKTHFRDGYYYKDAGGFMKWFLPVGLGLLGTLFAPGIGSALGWGSGAGAGTGAALGSAGTAALAGTGVGAGGGLGAGLSSGAVGAGLGNLGGALGTGAATSATTGAGMGAGMKSILGKAGGTIGQAGGSALAGGGQQYGQAMQKPSDLLGMFQPKGIVSSQGKAQGRYGASTTPTESMAGFYGGRQPQNDPNRQKPKTKVTARF